MKKKKESWSLGRLLKKIAPKIGASVLLEPEWEIVGQIRFKSGKLSYFRYNTLDLNPMGGSDIARDKDYANFFMKEMGYPIVPGSKTFFSDRWAKAIGSPRRNITAAYRHAKSIGFPVIVKPNSGSQGIGVSLVHTKREFDRAARAIFAMDKVMLVQKPVRGKDYRVVVIDDEIVSAYERVPLNVTGDGKSTIKKLLEAKQKEFVAVGRDTSIKFGDTRMAAKLSHQKLSFRSVPDNGQVVFLLDNANLSTGGDSVDVTDAVHPDFKELAVRITRDMGLRLCGVDFMIDGSIGEKPDKYWILEINSAPGLDHYVKMGKAQEKIVEGLYLKVLKHMER